MKKNKKLKKVRLGNIKLIAIAGLFGSTALIVHQVMAAPTSAPPSGKEWQLKWSDEFDGTSLDMTKWTHATGRVTGAQNCYAEANTTVSGGTAKIEAKYEPNFECYSVTRDFTSGFINTKDKHYWKYGYFEARMKLPKSDSMWPAFWMSPQDSVYGSHPRSGEIDIMEARGFDPTHANGDVHWGISDSDRTHKGKQGSVDDFRDWHTYGLEWSEGKLQWFIDGVLYHTVDNFGAPNATTHPGPFNEAFYIRLCMQVGGPYLVPHEDAYQTIAQMPATMEIDHVRVYQLGDAGETGGGETGGGETGGGETGGGETGGGETGGGETGGGTVTPISGDAPSQGSGNDQASSGATNTGSNTKSGQAGGDIGSQDVPAIPKTGITPSDNKILKSAFVFAGGGTLGAGTGLAVMMIRKKNLF